MKELISKLWLAARIHDQYVKDILKDPRLEKAPVEVIAEIFFGLGVLAALRNNKND